jgi:hypothetical protein
MTLAAPPQKFAGSSYHRVFLGTRLRGFKANVATNDRFQFPFPLTVQRNVISSCPIVLASWWREDKRQIDIAIGS